MASVGNTYNIDLSDRMEAFIKNDIRPVCLNVAKLACDRSARKKVRS